MTDDDRKNIKVPKPIFDRHKQRKEELGQTWPGYMDRLHHEADCPAEWDGGAEEIRELRERVDWLKSIVEDKYDVTFRSR